MSESIIPEERLKMLKEKYPGLTDEQISEIAESVSLRNVPDEGLGQQKEPESGGEMPNFLGKLGGGEMTMAEALVLMDFFDRKQAREDARRDEKIRRAEIVLENRRLDIKERELAVTKPKQPEEAEATKHLKEMDEKIDRRFEKLEGALTEKRVEDAEKRAQEAESKLKDTTKEIEHEKLIEAKVQEKVTPLSEANKTLEETVKTLNEKLQNIPKGEKDTLMANMENTFKNKMGDAFTEYIMERLNPKEKEPSIQTKEGGQVDWGKELPKMIYKSIDTIGEFIKKIPPPGTLPSRKEVTPMEVPGGAPAPTPEQLEALRRLKETIEKAEATATPPPSTQAEKPYFPPQSNSGTASPPTTQETKTETPAQPTTPEPTQKPPEEIETKENISIKTKDIPTVESAPVESKPEEKPTETPSIPRRTKKQTGKSLKE